MQLFNVIELNGRRIVLLAAASAIAAGAGLGLAKQAPSTHSSSAVMFTSQLFRTDRTDGELQNLVEDLILATELSPVTDAVEEETGLKFIDDYQLIADRAVPGGDTIEIIATASSASDAEAIAKSVGVNTLEYILGQDQTKAAASQTASQEAVSQILVRLDEIETEAGGLNPVILHTQAQEQLAALINDTAPGAGTALAEAQLRERIVTTSALKREYERLESQLEGYQATELADLSQSGAAQAALDSDIVVVAEAEADSSLPLIIQAVLVAVLATLMVGLGLFALMDRRGAQTSSAKAPNRDVRPRGSSTGGSETSAPALRTEPARAEPGQASRTEPARTKPLRTEPVRTKPANRPTTQSSTKAASTKAAAAPVKKTVSSKVSEPKTEAQPDGRQTRASSSSKLPARSTGGSKSSQSKPTGTNGSSSPRRESKPSSGSSSSTNTKHNSIRQGKESAGKPKTAAAPAKSSASPTRSPKTVPTKKNVKPAGNGKPLRSS